MRQVFTSPRIENVEGVARLLEEAGVQVRITNARSFRGAIRGNFSYREQARRGAQPEVWVLRSEDYPRARQVLREAGLEQRGHAAGGGFAGPSMHGAPGGPVVVRRTASRARRGALVVVALAVAAGYFGVRWAASRAPAAAPVAASVAPQASELIGDGTAIHRQPVPPALAELLVGEALQALPAATRACVTIDGAAPPPGFGSAQLRARLLPASRCEATTTRIAIDEYRTDGSGVGTIRVAAGAGAMRTQVLEVQRSGLAWSVLDRLPAADGP